jgi:DNA-binding CsgD family transcriptional regulator
MRLKEILSHDDAVTLLEITSASLSCSNEGHLKEILSHFQRLIPFDYAACAVSGMNEKGAIESSHIINVSYPKEWIRIYSENRYYECDPVFIENFNRFGLQYWRDTYRKYEVPKAFHYHAMDYDLRDGYTHGMKNDRGNIGSLLSISGDLLEPDLRTETILNIFIPFIHQALIKLTGPHNRVGRIDLLKISEREKEVLKWLKAGKDTWGISKILGISQNTVIFHVRRVKKKLDVTTRTQAVAVALEKKVIDFD